MTKVKNENRKSSIIKKYSLYFFIAIIITYLFLIPLLKLVSSAFLVDNSFSLNNFKEILSDKNFYDVLKNTIFINFFSTLFAGIIGITFAYIMAYTDIKHKKLISILLLIPLVIPGYIITLAWMQFMSPNGIVKSLFSNFNFNIYSYAGIILVFAVTKYPLIYTLTLSTFRKIPLDVELASNLCGCSRLKTFFKVTFPMSLSGIMNGLLLVFLTCLDNFGTVAFLGIPANISVLSIDIYRSVISFSSNNLAQASVKAIILIIISLVVSSIAVMISKKYSTGQTEVEDMNPRIHLKGSRFFVNLLVWGFIIIINFMPLIVMIMTAFTKGIGVKFNLKNIDLYNFNFVLTNNKSLNGIKNSAILALLTVVICLVIGTVVAYLNVKKSSKFAGYLQNIITIPNSIPGIILGLSLVLSFSKAIPIINVSIYGTIWILLLSYVVRFSAVQMRASSTGILQMDSSMEEAASICGASEKNKWFKVIIPLIGPSMLTGMGLVFINALTELTTSSLLWSGGSETIGVVIYNFTSAGKNNIASAYSTVVILSICAMFIVFKLINNYLMKLKNENYSG